MEADDVYLRSANARFSFFNLPGAAPPSAAALLHSDNIPPHCSYYSLPPAQQLHANAGPSKLSGEISPAIAGAGGDQIAMEAIKSKIVSHPHYTALLAAYLDCQKMGAPAEVVERLTAVAAKLDQAAPRSAKRADHHNTSDPELDQFMEAYCNMLLKYREEVTRPIQEAMEYLRRVEAQLNTLTGGLFLSSNTNSAAADGKCGGMMSGVEDDRECGIDPQAEDKELKYQLLKKYSGYLSSLRQEFSKKKKKGKLPKEARQKLLNWWELHYKWPYPSESEKIALAETTGLDQKQINNWFINQRKRHWKPSEDMPLFMMEGYHPHVGAAAGFYMEGHYMPDGLYRLGS